MMYKERLGMETKGQMHHMSTDRTFGCVFFAVIPFVTVLVMAAGTW